MARIEVEIEDVDLENEGGRIVAGVRATCSECGHQTECFGTSDRSRKRALVMLREECPESDDGNNWYVDQDEDFKP